MSQVEESSLILVDNLSVFSCLGMTSKQVYSFCLYLTRTVLSKGGKVVLRLGSVGQNELLCLLRNISGVVVSVSALSTGVSRDVTGNMEVEVRGAEGDHAKREFQFRLEDKNVRLFA